MRSNARSKTVGINRGRPIMIASKNIGSEQRELTLMIMKKSVINH